MTHYTAIIIGGGPSGISCGHHLSRLGIDYLIIERAEMLQTWKNERWDSFYLVTPNWMTNIEALKEQIPFDNAYMSSGEIVKVLEAYLDFVNPAYMEQTRIDEVLKKDGKYMVYTNRGDFSCEHLVVATGMFNQPFVPQWGNGLPEEVLQIHSMDYKNTSQVAKGNVLVVGSGRSGIQIALEIKSELGAEVYLSVGSIVPLPVIYKNTNGVYWLNRLSGYKGNKEILSYTPEDLKQLNILNKMNQNLKSCQTQGVKLVGRMINARGTHLEFAADLPDTLAKAKAELASVTSRIDDLVAKEEITVSDFLLDDQFAELDHGQLEALTELDLVRDDIRTVIWCTGFKPDYTWLKRPIFDADGNIAFESEEIPEEHIYFCGLGLSIEKGAKSSFGVGLYAFEESAERAITALNRQRLAENSKR